MSIEEQTIETTTMQSSEIPADAGHDFSKSVEIEVTPDRGVLKQILIAGTTGEFPSNGDEVFVHYIGRLVQVNGKATKEKKVFDQNLDDENPFKFKLGKGMVIRGWEKGITSMQKGEKSLFTLSPEYAYGTAGAGASIPANATLEFEVTLLDIKSNNNLTSDGQVKLKMTFLNEKESTSPKAFYEVTVAYKGRLEDETVFEECDAFTFTVSKDAIEDKYKTNIADLMKQRSESAAYVPPFFSEAIIKFHKGDKGKIHVGSMYAFGNEGNDALGVPPDANVVYELELIDFKRVEFFENNIVSKKVLHEGASWEMPNDGAKVTLQVVGLLLPSKKIILEQKMEEVVIGNGDLPDVLEIGLLEMKKGEKAEIRGPAEWFLGTPFNAEVTETNDSTNEFSFQVELIDFKKCKESYEMSMEEKIVAASECRQTGNAFFKKNQFRNATKKYEKAVSFFNQDKSLPVHERDQKNGILLPCYLNLAACYLKLKQYFQATEACDKALVLDPFSVKALYRRAQSFVNSKDFDSARNDLVKALSVESNESSCLALLKQVNIKLKQQDEKEKAFYARMLNP